MAVVAADIKLRLSVTSGTDGDADASTPAGSLGKHMATTAITDATPENLFPNVTLAEAGTGITRYRCFFFFNDTASGEDWEDVAVYIESQIAGGATCTIGLDPTGVTASNSSSDQAVTIADEETAPAGVTFSAPGSYGAGLAVGTVQPDECFAVWVELTVVPNVEALNLDDVVVVAAGATEP